MGWAWLIPEEKLNGFVAGINCWACLAGVAIALK